MSSTRIEHLNPEALPRNPAFTQVVTVSGPAKTIYIGGQNGVDSEGRIVGDDLGAQTEQVFRKLEAALAAAGAKLEHLVKWDIHVVEGHTLDEAVPVFGRVWGNRPNPLTITVSIVKALANDGYPVELDAIAVVPE